MFTEEICYREINLTGVIKVSYDAGISLTAHKVLKVFIKFMGLTVGKTLLIIA